MINAGVGGMNIKEATTLGQRLFSDNRPFLIALALGANDADSESAGRDFTELVKTYARLSDRLISIAVTSDRETSRQIASAAAAAEVPYIDPDLPQGSKMRDGVHYTGTAYAKWIPALQGAITSHCADHKPPS